MVLRINRIGLVVAIFTGFAALALAAPAPPLTTETVKDRTAFVPYRKYQPLPSKVVGLLVGNVAPTMAAEGRFGPPDAMAFSSGGGSYRWTYVPVTDKPLITGLSVPLGEKGDRRKTYPSLSMANPQTIKQWDISGPYALVEVEVNDGEGTPSEEGFVATKMTRLDGTKEYPLQLAAVVKELGRRYQTWKSDNKAKLDDALEEARKKALGDKKATGPQEVSEVFHITWLPDKDHLRATFKTKITDGAYQMSDGGPAIGPFPLPVPPKGAPAARDLPPAAPKPPPPPPPPFRRPSVRFGTQFGIEYGVAYEVTKSGRVDRILLLPPESFKNELPPPPGPGAADFPPPPLPPRR